MTRDEAKGRLLFGDMDKDFHRPECECEVCERWRLRNEKPMRKELHRIAGTPPEKPK